EVLRDRRLGDGKARRQVLHRCFPAGEGLEDRAPTRVGQRLKDLVFNDGRVHAAFISQSLCIVNTQTRPGGSMTSKPTTPAKVAKSNAAKAASATKGASNKGAATKAATKQSSTKVAEATKRASATAAKATDTTRSAPSKAAKATTRAKSAPSKASNRAEAAKRGGPPLSAAEQLDRRIAELGDWRGQRLAELRALIREVDPEA